MRNCRANPLRDRGKCMLKRFTGAVLILLLSICAGCSRKNQNLSAPIPASERYVEAANTASGTYSIDANFNEDKQPSIVNISQAYARFVSNPEDSNKKDVLIVLVEKPLSRAALSIMDDADVEKATQDFREMLRNRDARGLVLRLPADAGDKTPPQIRAYFNGNDIDLGNLELEPKSFSSDKVEGHIKSTASSQQADVTFAVKLQPDVWTGGAFYQQPPSNLSPGQASGQIEINDRVVKLNHAYAQLNEVDLFDGTNTFEVWLTEKPLGTEGFMRLDAESASNVVVSFPTTAPADRSQVHVAAGKQFDSLPDVERDYAKYGKDAIEGRLYSVFLIELRERAYKMDVLFNAQMIPPNPIEGPVTTSEGGEQLPADGGAPAKAYLAAMERMKAARNFDEKVSVWLSVVTKDSAKRIEWDIKSLSEEQRRAVIDVFAPLENRRLTGGMIKDNKATLRFTGTSQGSKAEEAVNMHLEDGQWKIGRREIRVDE
ncbi:MAG TPA: hypothetical protein VGW58_13785 [Pyrinomonadaceae bacterium]|nr:hypothetical protein [Pyrinomonadaceae bacterium]